MTEVEKMILCDVIEQYAEVIANTSKEAYERGINASTVYEKLGTNAELVVLRGFADKLAEMTNNFAAVCK